MPGTALPSRRPTLDEVAREAGVSRATVSRVVNDSGLVRPEVSRTVQKAISRLGYAPNRAARSLVSRQTWAIALIVPEDLTQFFTDPFFSAAIQGISARLDRTDYVLSLLAAVYEPTHKTMRYLRGGNVDGALVVAQHSDEELLAELERTVPVVRAGRPTDAAHADACYVDVDNVSAARGATEHLLASGRRRVATIAGPQDMVAGIDRLHGWQIAMTMAGSPADAVALGDFTRASGAVAMRTLLAEHPDLDAVFVASDLMALGAMSVLQTAGRSVPGDVAVIGFDDSPAATASPVPLSTVRQPSSAVGHTMADMLVTLLDGHDIPTRGIVVPTSLVLRESA